MCFFKKPEKPKLPPVPDAPTKEGEATQAVAEDQRKKLRFKATQAATSLSGPLGDRNYGANISRAVTLGGV